MDKKWLSVVAIFLIELVLLLPVSFAVSISDIAVMPQTTDALVTWKTDVLANSKVDYGLTTNLGKTAFDSLTKTDHSIGLSGLIDGVTYYYKVTSTDQLGSTNSSAILTFDTVDGTPPGKVTGLYSGTITRDSIQVLWTANPEPDLARYMIWQNSINVANVTVNEYTAIGLAAGTSYAFEIAAVDTTGNVGAKGVISLSTQEPDTTGPAITNISLSESTSTTIKVSWDTDEPSNGFVYYSIGQEKRDLEYKSRHSLTLTGLVEYQEYTYQIRSCDEFENCVTSETMDFIAGSDVIPPFVVFSLPELWNLPSIDVEVSTEPRSTLIVYVNGIEKKRVTTETGNITITGIPLNVNEPLNSIRIKAIDLFQNENYVEHALQLDLVPPVLDIGEMPSIANQNSFTLTGNSDEEVKLVIYKYLITHDSSPPAKVRNLRQRSLQGSSVTIDWDASIDAKEYLVHRDDVGLIAVTSTNYYYDDTLNISETYTYKVAARDENCNAGTDSDALIVSTETGTPGTRSASPISSYCSSIPPPIVNRTVLGSFEEEIMLEQGQNQIDIILTDKAGNSASMQQIVLLDTEAPSIESTTFSDHSPSYAGVVNVQGKVSEKATVYIYQNHDYEHLFRIESGGGLFELTASNGDSPRYVVETDEDGKFSVEIHLERDAIFRCDQPNIYSDKCQFFTNNGWQNLFEIVAVDSNGLMSNTVKEDIVYGLCGAGSGDWNIVTSQITPSILVPRHLLDGIAEFGFSAELNWQGPGRPEDVAVTGLTLNREPPMSPEERTYWDNSWISTIQATKSVDNKNAYFLARLKAPVASGETDLEQENNLSNHNMGNCLFGFSDQYGCARFFMQMEISYSYFDQFLQNRSTRFYSQCIQQEIAIDKRVPSDQIPKDLLNATIQALTAAIDAIDLVLEPLKTVRNYVFIACLGSWLVWFFVKVTEWSSCSTVLAMYDDGCDPNDQETGDDCKACLEKKVSTAEVWQNSQFLCDRIICNSAPTFEKYLRDSQDSKDSHCAGVDLGPDFKYTLEDNECDGSDEKYYEILGVPTSDFVDGLGYPVKTEECCKREYVRYADTMCLAMDELHESGCINQKAKSDEERAEMGLEGCGGLSGVIRTVSGICTSREMESYTMSIQSPQPGGPTRKIYITGDENHRAAYKITTTVEKIETKPEERSGLIPAGEIDKYFIKGEKILDSQDRANGCYKGKERLSYEQWITNNNNLEAEGWINKEVYYLVCSEQEDMVVDPTSGIVRSIQCVCLTAIVSYLNLWKSVMVIARNCLQTILYTGDGDSGMCKSFLSIYLCDLIYYAIKCIIENSTKSATGSERYEGLGGFLKYVSDSGSSVEGGIKQRYGASSLYQTLFLERKLMHAICAFAFTGDFNLDIDALLDQTAPTPVESIAVVAPATRRFSTSNPARAGRASFIYHLGALLVAGADLNYNIDLVCSKDNSCDEYEGFVDGYCDCFYKGAEERYHLKSGVLRNGDNLNEDIYEVVRDHDVRYDRACIEYSYTNTNGQRVTPPPTCTQLVEVGGNPPAECTFDIPALYFHCAYEWGEVSCARFTRGPMLGNDPNSQKNTFYPGDTIQVYGTVEKTGTSSANNDLFWMSATLYDAGSTTGTIRGPEFFPLNGPGIYDLDGKNIPGWTISEDMFALKGSYSVIPIGGLSISTNYSNAQSGRIDLKAGDPRVDVTFSVDSGKRCSQEEEIDVSVIKEGDVQKFDQIKVSRIEKNTIEIIDNWTMNKEIKILSYNSLTEEIIIEYWSGRKFTIRGHPIKDSNPNTENCIDTISIVPPPAGSNTEQRNVRLQLSLHRGEIDGSESPQTSVISCDNQLQTYSLPPFTISQSILT